MKVSAVFASFAYVTALVASLLWFTAAFRYFSFQQVTAAKMLVPTSARGSQVFLTLAASLRFLGGMNGAFALLSAGLLVNFIAMGSAFTDPIERGVLLTALAAAHFSQFIFNVPVLISGERQGEAFWIVRSGPMLFIFVIDAAETLLNLGAALVQFLS